MKQARIAGPRSVLFVRIPSDLAGALKHRAKTEGVSLVALIITILTAWAEGGRIEREG